MADVDLKIGGHHYRVACEAGQENELTELAATIDAEIMRMRAQAGNLGEAKQLLYAALTLADRVREAEAGAPPPSPAAFSSGEDDELIDRLAERMEMLADTLEKRAGLS